MSVRRFRWGGAYALSAVSTPPAPVSAARRRSAPTLSKNYSCRRAQIWALQLFLPTCLGIWALQMFVRVKKRFDRSRPGVLVALDFVLVESVRTAEGPRQRFIARIGCLHHWDLDDRAAVAAMHKKIAKALIDHGQQVTATTLAAVKRHAPLPKAAPELPPELRAMEAFLLSLPKSRQQAAKQRYKWLRRRARKLRNARKTGAWSQFITSQATHAAAEYTKTLQPRLRSSS